MTDSDVGATPDQINPDSVLYTLPDQELTQGLGAGSGEALRELWQRHSVFGLVACQAESPSDAEELNERAWNLLIEDTRTSSGPQTGFRPYLYLCVNQEASPTQPVSDASIKMTEAFFSLSPLWQEVLWYLDVEQMSPEDVSLLTNLPTATILSTQAQARPGLRDAWLKVNTEYTPPQSLCRQVMGNSKALIAKTLSAHDNEAFIEHVSACDSCRTALKIARSMSKNVRELLLTGVAGVSAGTALISYLDANGPIVINEDPLPQSLADLFGVPAVEAVTVTEEPAPAAPAPTVVATTGASESVSRRRGLIPIIILGVLVIGLGVALLAMSLSNKPLTNPSTTSTPTVTASTPAVDPSTEFVPTTEVPPTEEPTPSPTAPTPVETTASQSHTTAPTKSATTKTTPTKSATTKTTKPATTKPATTKPASNSSAKAAKITSINTGSLHTFYPIISGTAEPGDKVSVKVGSDSVRVTADAKGDWSTKGPFPSLSAGSIKVTATGTKNTAKASKTFTMAAPPSVSIKAGPAHATVILRGVPNAAAQIMENGASVRLVKLDSSGTGSYGIALTTGSAVTVRYYENGRYGITSAPVTTPA